jgi:hypothetical protein
MCCPFLKTQNAVSTRAVLAVIGLLSMAGTVTDVAAQEPPPTVDRVIELHKSGVSENILVIWIKQANVPLKLTTDELLKLSAAKVPDRVVQTLMNPTSTSQAAIPGSAPTAPSVILSPTGMPMAVSTTPRASGATTDDRTAAGDPSDPMSTHDSGIYLYQTVPTIKMILLEPTAYTGANTSALLNSLISLVPKVTRANIPGNEAGIRVNETSPTFYFYFEDRAAGLGKPSFLGGISSPNQFVLVKLERKKNSRETSIKRESSIGGSSGTKDGVAFKAERLKAGLYKVTFPQPLAAAEYAFMVSSGFTGAQQAGAASPIQIFDFGVDILK